MLLCSGRARVGRGRGRGRRGRRGRAHGRGGGAPRRRAAGARGPAGAQPRGHPLVSSAPSVRTYRGTSYVAPWTESDIYDSIFLFNTISLTVKKYYGDDLLRCTVYLYYLFLDRFTDST